MVKALARAFRWRKMLDTGVHATLDDLAQAMGVATSYLSRVPRLTLLAPEIAEAILDGRQPAELRLDELLKRFPLACEGLGAIASHRSSARGPVAERSRNEMATPDGGAWRSSASRILPLWCLTGT
jgi:hypothetical protein